MKLHIQYFALLKDQRGLSEETIETDASTPEEAYQLLKATNGFTLETESLKVAVNEEFADWGSQLSEGDTLVFIPPVAGG